MDTRKCAKRDLDGLFLLLPFQEYLEKLNGNDLIFLLEVRNEPEITTGRLFYCLDFPDKQTGSVKLHPRSLSDLTKYLLNMENIKAIDKESADKLFHLKLTDEFTRKVDNAFKVHRKPLEDEIKKYIKSEFERMWNSYKKSKQWDEFLGEINISDKERLHKLFEKALKLPVETLRKEQYQIPLQRLLQRRLQEFIHDAIVFGIYGNVISIAKETIVTNTERRISMFPPVAPVKANKNATPEEGAVRPLISYL